MRYFLLNFNLYALFYRLQSLNLTVSFEDINAINMKIMKILDVT